MTNKKLYGWFSPSDKLNHISVYTTLDNKLVKVTCVTESPTRETYNYPDAQYVGEVVNWVSNEPNAKQ
jgi:hypothetical protein